MLGIHRTVRRAALMAAAVVLAGAFSAQSVRATTITYDSNGFENPPFQSTDTFTAAGNGVSNRDNLHVHYDGTAGSTASIYTGTTGGINPNKTSAGTQGLQINRSATGSNIGVTTSSFYNTNTVGNANTTTTVTTTVDINYDRAAFLPSPPAAPSTPGTGPFFGINLFGENGATGLGVWELMGRPEISLSVTAQLSPIPASGLWIRVRSIHSV